MCMTWVLYTYLIVWALIVVTSILAGKVSGEKTTPWRGAYMSFTWPLVVFWHGFSVLWNTFEDNIVTIIRARK